MNSMFVTSLEINFCPVCTAMGLKALRGREMMRRVFFLFVVLNMMLPALGAAAVKSLPSSIGKSSSTQYGSSTLRYGIDMNGYIMNTAIVNSGQTLSKLLKPYRIPASVVLQAAAISKNIFDVRRIKSGRPYAVVRDLNRGLRVRYFIYEQTRENYVVFDFGNPLRVFTGQKALESKVRVASGTITSSLWDAVIEQRLSSDLILTMADIFASTVDFHRLRRGDRFHVIYEEQYSEGKPVGIGAIEATILTHGDKRHKAFRHSHHDGTVGYYDEKGISMQKAFLKSPLKYTSITSGFSDKRLHPIKNIYRRHPAIDYGAPPGTPVMSVGGGVVYETGNSKTAGKYVMINHPGSYVSKYLHLASIAERIEKNAQVKRGEVIGFVGSTGLATNSHLDFRFMKNGRYLDYSTVELPDGESVASECKDRFNREIAQFKSRFSLADSKL